MEPITSSTTEALWTVGDAAAHLNVSRSWVYQRSARGELPCLKIGGVLRFEPEAIRAFARGELPRIARVIALKPR